jgi:hypothetical protein
MMLVEQFAGTTLVGNTFQSAGANANAYTAITPGGFRIAVFNKDTARDLNVAIGLPGARRAKLWRLMGPALDATQNITLAGAEVRHGDAVWSAKNVQNVAIKGAFLEVSVPHASAALLFVET